MRNLQITRVILYVKNVPRIAEFYERYFDMRPLPGGTEKWTELAASSGGCTIALHKASVAQKSGAAIKLVFGVDDIQAFKNAKEREGLRFGVIHEADGVAFCNTKDPAGNSLQISNRGF
jgi:catechol 2,3-dioxygenase-like lactoylglutathione lyase family enzyme